MQNPLSVTVPLKEKKKHCPYATPGGSRMSLRFHAALASTREMDPLRRDLGIDEGKW